ncbi:hypothetical protein J2S43_000612 [Catenuloplanes nepalensis]|uniref:Uncharacterized protein n=1 Tax=Catenuloplanes nepalensis TaxID=587533 RepID=A0ABT9MKZ7_9ACTN|nr:hypothetical protein [Catenuloplanes nepalensis]MDP9792100.1 hypothetical protein [Catenuloplanes nepalensis]
MLRRLAVIAVTAGAVTAALLPVAGPASAAPASFTKIQGAASNAAGLQGTVAAYRLLLGDPNNGSLLGTQPAGRREINWDGTPDAQSAPNALPRDFFNTTAPRGVVFSGASTFQVSADSSNPSAAPVRFGNINSTYPSIFGTFSPERLFTPVNTNKTTIKFFVPGSTEPAAVKGFGAVFTDVDKANTTRVDVYDRWGGLLWGEWVPAGTASSKSLSFLGVTTDADIAEVRITTGNAALGAWTNDTSSTDLVVMDDFLYGEPKALP